MKIKTFLDKYKDYEKRELARRREKREYERLKKKQLAPYRELAKKKKAVSRQFKKKAYLKAIDNPYNVGRKLLR